MTTRKTGSTPAERSLRARIAAYQLHSMRDSQELMANARAAFDDRFARQVDPEGMLPVAAAAERQRRAECARKAYFTALAAKSARARRARREAG